VWGVTIIAAGLLVGGMPLIAGHRGTGTSDHGNPYPENSIESIAQAFAEGADLVEVDVQLDADGVAILWHDKRVSVQAGGRYHVRDVARDELAPLVGSHGDSTTVPTFADALDLTLSLASCRLAMDVELKVYCECDRAALVRAVADLLLERDATARVIVTSSDFDALRLIESILPCIETGWIAPVPALQWPEFRNRLSQRFPIEWFIARRPWVASAAVARHFARQAHSRGIRLGIWTVDEPQDIAVFAEAGYDLIITNEPDVARDVFERRIPSPAPPSPAPSSPSAP